MDPGCCGLKISKHILVYFRVTALISSLFLHPSCKFGFSPLTFPFPPFHCFLLMRPVQRPRQQPLGKCVSTTWPDRDHSLGNYNSASQMCTRTSGGFGETPPTRTTSHITKQHGISVYLGGVFLIPAQLIPICIPPCGCLPLGLRSLLTAGKEKQPTGNRGNGKKTDDKNCFSRVQC